MPGSSSSLPYTIGGLLASILWASSICISRSLTEKIGTFTTATLIYLLSGATGIALGLISRKASFKDLYSFSFKYLLVCGLPFMFYMLSLYLAIGFAATRQQVVEIGLLNYLWPSLTLLFSIPILKNKARPALFPGILMALSGVSLASLCMNGEGFNISSTFYNIKSNFMAYFCGFSAAVLWALYSNTARLFGKYSNSLSTPLFMLFSGILIAAVGFFFPEKSVWTPKAYGELAFMVLLPGLFAYVLWALGMQKGNLIFLASAANMSPILSTFLSGLYLNIEIPAGIWAAALLVAAGSAVCHYSIIPSKT